MTTCTFPACHHAPTGLNRAGQDTCPGYADAICSQVDPEWFFPGSGESTREAKKVCAACPVRLKCLDFALANDERFGIWAGTSENERRRLRVQGRPKVGTCALPGCTETFTRGKGMRLYCCVSHRKKHYALKERAS